MKDAYPDFSDKHRAWFMALVEGMVSLPADANFARLKRGNDLEISIEVAPEDVHIFTPEVCDALKTLLGKVTDVNSPVVYLYDHPHPAAREAISLAEHNL
jgi:hypothetical protein